MIASEVKIAGGREDLVARPGRLSSQGLADLTNRRRPSWTARQETRRLSTTRMRWDYSNIVGDEDLSARSRSLGLRAGLPSGVSDEPGAGARQEAHWRAPFAQGPPGTPGGAESQSPATRRDIDSGHIPASSVPPVLSRPYLGPAREPAPP
ncbi:hypothetical protein RRF57_000833 [Xylaria bambusicola]|uniref:Uncharacterized protein n=1 Tax=Xylaria bambusicola TaxID=326684 RepID=A0AAN7Z124_9PEZI